MCNICTHSINNLQVNKSMKNNLILTKLFLITLFLNVSSLNAFDYPISAEELSCRSADPSFSISPSGKYLAIMTVDKENVCDIEPDRSEYVEDGMWRNGLTIVDLDTWEQRMLSDGSQGESISGFRWASDTRFLYWTDPRSTGVGKRGNAYTIFAMDIDGKNRTNLLSVNPAVEGGSSFGIYYMDMNDPDHIYVYWNNRRPRVADYYKLNIYTGKPELIAFGPDIGDREVIWNTIEDKNAMPAAVLTDVGIEKVLYTYNQETREWSEHYRYSCQNPHYTPMAVEDDDLWLVTGQKIGANGIPEDPHDTNALYLYEPSTKTFLEKVYEDKEYDIGGYTGGCRGARGSASIDPVTQELLSVNYVKDKPVRLFFNDELGRTYRALEQVFPDEYISISTSNNDKTRAIVFISNSDDPGEYYYLDLAKGELKPMWTIKPWLDRSKLSKKEFIKYKARDGLTIPAYLSKRTFDAGGNYFVILPHGGPNVKQSISFDPWVQFFTSRGFNVLQPDYRGSTGYGRNHYMLGNKQWGKTMQDDITDGVQWAVDNGYANSDQVCIAGASYGGYAAMAGAVFTPDLYSCVINFVGVSDMRDLLKNFGSRSSRFNTWEDEGRLEWGDDQGPDGKKYIEEISPILHVKNIKAPVLITHGANDYTVPLDHAQNLKREMDKHGKVVEYFVEAKEGHGFYGEAANVAHYNVQEAFLEKYVTKKK